MGGEMMYVLDQRLRAQGFPRDKAKKVLHDIINKMFNRRFIEELFKPQELYSKKAMRTVFERLAHASIMRLDVASMDKLYELMIMAVKHQIVLCKCPMDILLVTLNHVDSMRELIHDNRSSVANIDAVYKILLHTFGHLSPGEFAMARQTLFNFFQDL